MVQKPSLGLFEPSSGSFKPRQVYLNQNWGYLNQKQGYLNQNYTKKQKAKIEMILLKTYNGSRLLVKIIFSSDLTCLKNRYPSLDLRTGLGYLWIPVGRTTKS